MIIYIIGIGHSGSTLLDMVLGSHQDIFSLGEIIHFPKSYKENSICTCGQPIRQCNLWHQVGSLLDREMKKKFTNNPLNLDLNPLFINEQKWYQTVIEIINDNFEKQIKLNLPHYKKTMYEDHQKKLYTRDIINFYDIVKRVSGCNILIDSTKSSIRARTLIKFNPSVPQKCIHLVRDGRGFLYSKLKKQDTVLNASKTWLINNLFAEGLGFSLPSTQYIKIKYEDFCDSPDRVLTQICDFIGIGYDNNMLNFRSANHHNIGGNVLRYGEGNILKADQKWRNTLYEKDIRIFYMIAGWLNYLYGYR